MEQAGGIDVRCRAILLVGALLVATATPPAHAHVTNCRAILHRGEWHGTENQPNGITAAAPYGFAEIDADVTKDGRVVAVHDSQLGRLTGGDSTAFVNEVTWAELRDFDHPFGKFRLTSTLIARAAQENTPVMVTINRWGRIGSSEFADQTLDTLYAAAQAHPRPELVFFGGADDPMLRAHPDASTFVRYHKVTADDVVANVVEEGVDLVGLPAALWQPDTVQRVRQAGAWVATRELDSARRARRAQSAGIKLIQGDDPRLIATEWCR
jgi:glycerophosphoryl diester phosphodiesterase